MNRHPTEGLACLPSLQVWNRNDVGNPIARMLPESTRWVVVRETSDTFFPEAGLDRRRYRMMVCGLTNDLREVIAILEHGVPA